VVEGEGEVMSAKYKVGQEVQTSDGDRHEVVGFKYAVKRIYAKPIAGIPHGIGCLNTYEESDLTPYVRPLQVGDRVRLMKDEQPWKIVAVDDLYAWIRSEWGGQHKTAAMNILERIPTESA
jgi:hypothetical protein